MKNNNLKNGLLAALVLSSSVVYAEEQYPATNFQPTIVYQDEALIAKGGSQSAQSAASKTQAAADDKYPAANFQPEVVYNDPSYKHGSGSIGSASTSNTASSSNTATSSESTEAKASDSTITSYLFGLVVMALGGVAFFRSSKCVGKCTKSSASSTASSNGTPGGLTGVAKYLSKTSGTGVSRYVEKQIGSVKATAAQAATGVEKYIRNRR